jgi:PIN domain nuclease of toxin-antitoxin system
MIWAIGQSNRLRPAARTAIEDSRNEVLVSAVSAWEATIKATAGRLSLPGDLADGLEESRFAVLDVTIAHGLAAGALPRHHGDPFDRMLIAQAQLEGLTIVTSDAHFAAYDVALLPA